MALKFGGDVDDVDPAEIMAMLEAEDLREAGGTQDGPPDPDPEPGYPKESFADRLFADDPGPVRVTKAIEKDIRAKTAMLLTVGASTWMGRDPACGGALLGAIPDHVLIDEETGQKETVPGIATSLADIFCDSPDVVKWFTSGGKYVKWLQLASALQPVLATVWGHHVAHTVTEEPEEDWDGFGTG